MGRGLYLCNISQHNGTAFFQVWALQSYHYFHKIRLFTIPYSSVILLLEKEQSPTRWFDRLNE